jgi:hypothetical protein
MKERTIVFSLLLPWALAYGVKSSLGNPSTTFKRVFQVSIERDVGNGAFSQISL